MVSSLTTIKISNRRIDGLAVGNSGVVTVEMVKPLRGRSVIEMSSTYMNDPLFPAVALES